MLFATTLGGMFFYAVHICARYMPQSEYGIVLMLLQVLNQMAIPAMGLQTIFVQQAALAETEGHRRDLAGAVRSVLKATFIIWLVAVALVWVFQGYIMVNYKITNPVALWATLGLGLTSLWLPLLTGIMLGRQNFLWAGINSIAVAMVRLLLVGLIVFVFLGPVFSGNDLRDVAGLASKLKQPDPLATNLVQQLSSETQKKLAEYQGGSSGVDALKAPLARDLARLIGGTNNLYSPALFQGKELRPETLALSKQDPRGVEMVRLNRWLLEDAFPQEIARRPLPLGWYAAGTVIGVLLAMGAGVVIGVSQTYRFWMGQAARFVWKPWIKRIIPLTLGTGAITFMFTVDQIVVQRFLEGTGHYGTAGMIARAIMFLVAPMVMVMFPKIVRSAAKSEETDVLGQTLGLTALIAVGAAIFATFFAKIPILIIQGPNYLPAVPLVPWFTWCILPLTVSSVLVNNLMARQQYRVVPWLVLVALAYITALWQGPCHASHLTVIRTMGVFAFLFFMVCVWFTWGTKLFKPAVITTPGV